MIVQNNSKLSMTNTNLWDYILAKRHALQRIFSSLELELKKKLIFRCIQKKFLLCKHTFAIEILSLGWFIQSRSQSYQTFFLRKPVNFYVFHY